MKYKTKYLNYKQKFCQKGGSDEWKKIESGEELLTLFDKNWIFH